MESVENMTLSDLDLSVRTFNVLRREGYETVKDVLDHLPYIAERAKKAFKEICPVLKEAGYLPYAPGDYVEKSGLGDPLAFKEPYSLIGELAVIDVSTESRKDYKVVLITSISEGHGERRVVFSDAGGGLGNILDIYFKRDKPTMYRIKESRNTECSTQLQDPIEENHAAAPTAAALSTSETPVNGAEIQSTWRNSIMEITMTLTVTPTQAEQIAKLLQGVPAADASPMEMWNSAVPAPTPAPAVPTAPAAPAPYPTAAPVAMPQAAPAPYPTAPTAPTAPAPAVPTASPAYTLPQLQTALAPLLDAGRAAQVQQLVNSFGAATLMDIPPERYGELANGIRTLGGAL